MTGVRVPRQSAEPEEMDPFSELELEEAYARWHEASPRLADILLLMAWTGLRWAEARSLRVEDLVEIPTPGLLVRRSRPEGGAVKSTKGRSSRRVPLATRVLPIALRLREGQAHGELLLTTDRGAQLHRSAVLRTLDWPTTGRGRRIHDLRHTAACLWLARGVDPGTVQAWMGHESIGTTNHSCTSSAPAPNWPAWSGSTSRRGTPGGHIGAERAPDNDETPPDVARLRWSDGVSKKWS